MRKAIFVGIVLLIGFLMPYLSRVPLAFKFGASWIWEFTPDLEAFVALGGVFIVSLFPVALFGMLFILSKFRWGFYVSALTHAVGTAFFYYNIFENPRDEPLALAFIPIFLAVIAFVSGSIGFLAELLVKSRKSEK